MTFKELNIADSLLKAISEKGYQMCIRDSRHIGQRPQANKRYFLGFPSHGFYQQIRSRLFGPVFLQGIPPINLFRHCLLYTSWREEKIHS